MAPRFRKVEGEPYVRSVQFTGFGQEITGVYVQKRTRESRYGRDLVADLRMENGEIKAVVLSQDLISKMAKVPLGSTVRIKYGDDLDVGQRSPMRIFEVEVAEDDGEPEGDETEPKDEPF